MRRQRKDRFLERRVYNDRIEALAPVFLTIFRHHRVTHQDLNRPRRRKRAIVKAMTTRAARLVKRGDA